jgi:hypothetical protein
MKNVILGVVILLFLGGAQGLLSAEKPAVFTEYENNPVYGQHHGDGKAYYPCVIRFADHYKMWYDDGNESIWLLTSTDGLVWSGLTAISGLNSPRHPSVVYHPDFGYKIYYWDGVTNQISTRVADSSDGIHWVNDRVITQDPVHYLVGGEYGSWWYHHYGPAQVIYNPHSKNNGDNPWHYSFVMTFDTASEKTGAGFGIEHCGLAYSMDGNHWKRYGNEPILKAENNGTWDDDYSYHCIITHRGNNWRMWYCGSNYEAGGDYYAQGIGEAHSSDGLTWSKFPNPVLHIDDGAAWRSVRTYTPWVLLEGSRYKMWFTGKSGSNYSIGFAEIEKPSNMHSK